MCFRKISRKVSRMFQDVSLNFFLQFCCCMALIAATRAEGGLVLGPNCYWGQRKFWPRIVSQYAILFLNVLPRMVGPAHDLMYIWWPLTIRPSIRAAELACISNWQKQVDTLDWQSYSVILPSSQFSLSWLIALLFVVKKITRRWFV